MIRINEHQDWDFHKSDKFLYLDGDEIVGSFTINYNRNSTVMESMYIQPEHRGKGRFEILMTDLLDTVPGELFIQVRKGSWIIEHYKKYGFEFYREANDNFDWMVRNINKEL